MEQIVDVLIDMRRRLDPDERHATTLPIIKARWQAVVGRRLAALMTPVRLIGTTLTVEVEDHSVLKGLGTFAQEIIGKCNSMFEMTVLSRVEGVPRAVEPPATAARSIHAAEDLPEHLGSHIRDPGLRAAFRRTCAAYLDATADRE